MQNIDSNTPRVTRTIGGLLVSVVAPYAEGHVVTAGEAAMLNQTLAENFSNNLRSKIEKFVPEGSAEGTEPRQATVEEAQALVDAYAASYEPGVRRTGTGAGKRVLDPIEKEMRSIAKDSLNALLANQGLKKAEVQYDDLLESILEQHGETLRAKATKIVKARSQNALEDLDLGAITKVEQGTEAAEPVAA